MLTGCVNDDKCPRPHAATVGAAAEVSSSAAVGTAQAESVGL